MFCLEFYFKFFSQLPTFNAPIHPLKNSHRMFYKSTFSLYFIPGIKQDVIRYIN